MKKLLIVIFLYFFPLNISNANDIKNFQIEGISIGDSLLDYFSKEKINNSIVDWYDHLEKNKFVAIALESKDFETYDFVDVFTKFSDDKYFVTAVSGVAYFGPNKTIKSIDDCYKQQGKIADEIQLLFKGVKKEPYTEDKPNSRLPKKHTDIYFKLKKNYSIFISCYDYYDKEDHLWIGIRPESIDKWLQ